jgi:GMP synthase (glutamine-hydrolysing)
MVFCLQGDCRSYSYVVGLSSEKEPDWDDMLFLARLIPRVCHNVNRVCYIWGGLVRDQVLDITPTFLTSNVLSTLRQADHVASQVSRMKLKYIIFIVWILLCIAV